jgi:beta-lactamase superfamily II metal-dependent hydrolase
MKLTVFPSGKGDCLLLEAATGERMLVDGGTREAYRGHVAGVMGSLRRRKIEIALAMVSHTDSDHIGGVLQLLNDEVDARVHEYQRTHGNPHHRKPGRPRPPVIRELWHNGFGELLKDDVQRTQGLLDQTAGILAASSGREGREGALDRSLLAQSIPEALRLARRASAKQLGIPVNPGFRDGLVVVEGQPVRRTLGSLDVLLVGPRKTDVDRYREEWRMWLMANEKILADIRREARADEAAIRQGEGFQLVSTLIGLADELGDRTRVTPPNLASIMALVTEDGRRLLLTGDGHGDDVLASLGELNLLDGNGGIHVDVLKVQHHGSEHNITEAFARAVTADHYIFCGNGEHQNPDLRVVRLIATSRVGGPSERSPNAEVDRPFQFWFNTSIKTTKAFAANHVRALESAVRKLANGSRGRMTYRFMGDDRFTIKPA